MDFSYDENQQMLADSIDRFMTDRYSLQKRAALLDDPKGQERLWKDMADLGWVGAVFGEDVGGFASSPVDAMVVAERLGRHIATLPFTINAVLCGKVIEFGMSGETRDDILGSLIGGHLQMAPAIGGNGMLRRAGEGAFTAAFRGDGAVISGRMPVVLNADRANVLIVAARADRENETDGGVSLFIVSADADGVSRRPFRMIDGHGAAEVVLSGVEVGPDRLIGRMGGGGIIFNRARDHAVAALCGEALGSMTHLVQATAEYTRTREQYGAPLAKFQVLQHRMADMYIQTETARSMAYVASMALDLPQAQRGRDVSAAKVQAGRSGKFVGYQAVQLHGGMGVSEELDIGWHYIRLQTIARLFGDHAFHLRRFAAMSDRVEAA